VNLFANIKSNDLTYCLPENRIAKYPLERRDLSKLLCYNRGKIESWHFSDIPSLLNQDHYLVLNDTRVIMARLLFKKKSGAEIEIFLLEPFNPADYSSAFTEKTRTTWKCLVGNAKKWKSGKLSKTVEYKNSGFTLHASITGTTGNTRLVLFEWDNQDICFSEILNHAGLTPIPPYLKRKAEATDKDRYQTIYSHYEGSVAAPTAGLHFTPEVFQKLAERNIMHSSITLHVGAGTFIPVKKENILLHDMHVEQFVVKKSCIEQLLQAGKSLIPVGTTSLRALETLYWLGVKFKENKAGNFSTFLNQWEPYHLQGELSRTESLEILLDYMIKQGLDGLKAATKIMIIPGYRFKMTDGMITNFHQPNSTLLLLIAAYTGSDWKKIYAYALENDYRFLSYGDSSLLFSSYNDQKNGVK